MKTGRAITALLMATLLGCPTPAPAPQGDWANVAPARIEEVLRADGRVYLRVVEGEWDFWVAVDPMAIEVGDHVLMGKGPERKRFLSPELKRRFSVMTFVDSIAVVSLEQTWAAIQLQVPPGGISIGALFEQRAALAGQTVTVRGRVIKANKGIFNTNWYHLADGTGADGTNDLTVTSLEDVQLGDVVRIQGVLTTDKDLGFGYFYPAIVEDAVVVVESTSGS